MKLIDIFPVAPNNRWLGPYGDNPHSLNERVLISSVLPKALNLFHNLETRTSDSLFPEDVFAVV